MLLLHAQHARCETTPKVRYYVCRLAILWRLADFFMHSICTAVFVEARSASVPYVDVRCWCLMFSARLFTFALPSPELNADATLRRMLGWRCCSQGLVGSSHIAVVCGGIHNVRARLDPQHLLSFSLMVMLTVFLMVMFSRLLAAMAHVHPGAAAAAAAVSNCHVDLDVAAAGSHSNTTLLCIRSVALCILTLLLLTAITRVLLFVVSGTACCKYTYDLR